MISRDVPGFIQFGKYGICGCIALLLHCSIVYSLGLTLNPAIGDYIPREVKETNAMWNNSIAFFPSNTVAYLLNVAFVFTPGRHSKRKEISLFFILSSLSFLAGHLTIWAIFRSTDTNHELGSYQENIEHLVNLGFVISSVLVNFVCRKFIIFQK
ncbi:MAG: GtrA family protein [Verrucomicrobiales bacterium]